MSPLDAYLNTLSWAMGGTLPEQQAVRDELRAHIESAARDLELQGMSADAAIRAALTDLGEPEALGRELRASRGTSALRRPLVQPAGAVLLDRPHTRALPDLRLSLALALWSITGAVAVVIYAWPG